ncbi:transcriptional regulator, AlpA family [Thermoanaerobacter thermohydrosulfuricus]|uniref:Transcriptional regulator, AlpA family n=1 Tax=Thermoanaerobacter thermohydrosulfuricus TaxID=1516 RepID=A0A1G7IXD4_THETY|nr:helix-turn-helix domain-containing protein [Thermoanaerobacter thermohydrosulfuricus]SDF17350.1 transcriptional regulator, AlpA family [Thermoanaerobacter thermohydrosulfuricus]
MISILNELKYRYNLSEQELAQKIGISRSQLYRIKKKGKISKKFIIGIKNAFPEVSIDKLIESLNQQEEHSKIS